ncbi:DUF882 domain-containing protein [Kumtagia ephedrae]|uniref:Murein endopeptidase K n=1 Tax=Kumtagia ephedrae TaxID=2116701 RepID=A0A2P7SLL6_9HYPH|nr:DUF882 domain-containing protein [Mesorhizobium ephedrae]PSJ63380.1 peptidase M15 [Mesorhizobium ephedrae]
MIALCAIAAGASAAAAETRTLKLYFTHTGERAEITYKRNGRYDQAGLRKVNQFLRDWRRNEPTKMDPRLLDLVWSVYRTVGARDYIHVVSAYRSPATNSMLRSRSKGVARKSQHMLGKAMDFYIPGVSLKKLREAGMKMQIGGVGYYPRSGSPFVHMDVGNVRHWPKMSRRELVAMFPNGKTLHVPSDGKPLPGFEQALASYESRKKDGTMALALASGGGKPSRGLLAALFGGGGEDEDEEAAPAPAPRRAEKPKPPVATAVAKAEPQPQPQAQKPGIQILSPEEANRTELPTAEPEEKPQTPEQIIAALPMRAVPLPALAPRPNSDPAAATEVAAAETPQDMPFGMAEQPPAELASPAAAEMAMNVPLPTPRPDLGTAQPVQAAAPQEQILLALASAERDPATASDAIPMPFARPADDAELPMAMLPGERPSLLETATPDDRAAVAAAIKANGERVAALASEIESAPKRTVSAGIDPQSVASLGVKTTRKAARPTAGDVRPDRKSQARTVEPQAARWVLSQDYVTTASQNTTAPSFAYNAVVTAPREVYTAGFKKDGEGTPDPNRFTGKAVEFLSVARFE